jgi:dihydrofolate reductase
VRTVTAGLFSSLDGVVEAPNLWQYDSFDDELGAALGQVMERTDAVVLGRVGYEQWAGYWPDATADSPFADFINGVPKHVASRTMTGELDWSNASLIEGTLEDFVAGLKQGTGGDIAVMGGISVVRQLLFAGLLDELTVMIHPVIAGSGRRLFEPGDPRTRLALVRGSTTSAGNLLATYRLRQED